jgi:hypothetical protein
MSQKKSNHPKNDHSEAQQNEAKESTKRHVYVEPGVQIDLVKNFRESYESAQTQNTAHNEKQLRWTKVSAALILVYAGITLWQACLTRDVANTAQKQFQQDQRPWIWSASVQPRTMVSSQRLQADIHLVNYGKSPALEAQGVGKMFFGADAVKQANDWFASLGDGPLSKADARTVTVIPPGIPSDPKESPVFTTVLSDKVVTQDDIDFIIKTDFSAVTAIREQYTDTFGNLYYTDMCLFHFASNAIGLCKEHNTMH